MNFRLETLLQNFPVVALLVAKPLHFYDRQGKKNFRPFFPQD